VTYAVVGTDIRITVTLGVDITGATTKQIGYLKPGSGTPAYLTATVTDEPNGVMYADLPNATNDTAGVWAVFPWVVQSDGKKVSAAAQSFTVLSLGVVAGV